MSLSSYKDLIDRKAISFSPSGLKKIPPLNAAMFPYQQACTAFALETGCAGLFLATGLGKSLCSLDYGRVIVEHTNKPVLMLAPLAVSKQHEREAAKFGIDAKAIREPSEITGARIYITNYERLARFDASMFGCVILDESSILKGFNGRTSRQLIDMFAGMPFRLSATATPAPNDHMELGQQSEFLGCMRSMEMLSRWFINDTSTASQVWRLKGHATESFWNWVASWARCAILPSDLGFDDSTHVLPELIETLHLINVDMSIGAGEAKDGQGMMFRAPDMGATSIHTEKRLTSKDRANKVAELVAADPDHHWIVWVDTDYDADAVMPLLPNAVEVRGSMSADRKEDALVAFSKGDIQILVTKPSVAGFGMNWQHCTHMAFTGLSFSFESYHQAVRRCWRFGQKKPVHVHTVMGTSEKAIIDALARKKDGFDEMGHAMRAAMLRASNKQTARLPYEPVRSVKIPSFMVAA